MKNRKKIWAACGLTKLILLHKSIVRKTVLIYIQDEIATHIYSEFYVRVCRCMLVCVYVRECMDACQFELLNLKSLRNPIMCAKALLMCHFRWQCSFTITANTPTRRKQSGKLLLKHTTHKRELKIKFGERYCFLHFNFSSLIYFNVFFCCCCSFFSAFAQHIYFSRKSIFLD